MEIYPMLTGSQLRQYLHISTRKLKYLMDHHPPKPRPKQEPVFQPTPENCQRFRQWLAQRWANEPDALPIQRVAELLDCYPQKIHRWVKLGKLPAEQVGRFQYCSKAELISFLATPEGMMGCGEVSREFIRFLLAKEW